MMISIIKEVKENSVMLELKGSIRIYEKLFDETDVEDAFKRAEFKLSKIFTNIVTETDYSKINTIKCVYNKIHITCIHPEVGSYYCLFKLGHSKNIDSFRKLIKNNNYFKDRTLKYFLMSCKENNIAII